MKNSTSTSIVHIPSPFAFYEGGASKIGIYGLREPETINRYGNNSHENEHADRIDLDAGNLNDIKHNKD